MIAPSRLKAEMLAVSGNSSTENRSVPIHVEIRSVPYFGRQTAWRRSRDDSFASSSARS